MCRITPMSTFGLTGTPHCGAVGWFFNGLRRDIGLLASLRSRQILPDDRRLVTDGLSSVRIGQPPNGNSRQAAVRRVPGIIWYDMVHD